MSGKTPPDKQLSTLKLPCDSQDALNRSCKESCGGASRQPSNMSIAPKGVHKKRPSILNIRPPSEVIIGSIQFALQYCLSKLEQTPSRDVLMEDFFQCDICSFPSRGASGDPTPGHPYPDFTFKDYAPVAFRYFRDLFGIDVADFMSSLCDKELREISNAGASGSMFFVSSDDVYVIKSVDHREAKFLQELLPGYYMNLHQHFNTLLPKFFGLYCYSSLGNNLRLVVMNNLLPSDVQLHEKFDIKGSTFKRRASKKELSKKAPTFKDLDFIDKYPNGFILDPSYYSLVTSSIERDARVLNSFGIMDYSLLIGVHYVKCQDSVVPSRRDSCQVQQDSCQAHQDQDTCHVHQISCQVYQHQDSCQMKQEQAKILPLSVDKDGSLSKRLTRLSTEMRGLKVPSTQHLHSIPQPQPHGAIPARTSSGQEVLLYVGIIDILQNFRIAKKFEYGFKSIFHDGRTISVNKPKNYETRFLEFCSRRVFRLPEGCSAQEISNTTKRAAVCFTSPYPHKGQVNTANTEISQLFVSDGSRDCRRFDYLKERYMSEEKPSIFSTKDNSPNNDGHSQLKT